MLHTVLILGGVRRHGGVAHSAANCVKIRLLSMHPAFVITFYFLPWVHSGSTIALQRLGLCVELACSPCVRVRFLRALQFPLTAQRHVG